MEYVYGKIYYDGKFQTGYLGFKDGMIKSHGKKPSDKIRESAVASGLIIPTFRNAHIHLADSFLFGQISESSINKLVDPKKGLKMKKLKAASERIIVNSTRDIIMEMCYSGSSAFIDFREMGVKGINYLVKSLDRLPVRGIALGRPFDMEINEKEINDILKIADGIGLSAISDWPEGAVRKIARVVKKSRKMFALHVSEAVRENIDEVIDLAPNFIVHMLEATRKDMNDISASGIPVVVCPRANMFYGKYPDITSMAKAGIRLLLGTDNAMISKPDMLKELEYAYRCAKLTGGISPEELLKIAFDNPDILFSRTDNSVAGRFKRGSRADFVVIQVPGLSSHAHPENLLCLGLSSSQIEMVSIENFIWRRLK